MKEDLDKNFEAVFLETLRCTEIYSVIDSIKTVYVLLKKYDEFSRTEYIKCVNEYIDELKSEEFTENYRLGRTWDYFFDENELLRNMLIYHLKLEPSEWTNLFDKYTDYSTSMVNEFIVTHCDHYGLDLEDWMFYSSALSVE